MLVSSWTTFSVLLGCLFHLSFIWKESISCTLRLLWDVNQSTVSGNDQMIHFRSTVLICTKMLCRHTHHLRSVGAGTEHTQPLLKYRNCWRQWEWNEEPLKILEQIPVFFIIVSTNGDTEEEAVTGKWEKRQGLLTTNAFAVLPLSVTTLQEKYWLENQGRSIWSHHAIHHWALALESHTEGLPDEMNITQLTNEGQNHLSEHFHLIFLSGLSIF